MSARPKITLQWGGKSASIPDAGYVLDEAPAPAPIVPAQPGTPDYASREIGLRLENWSRWATSKGRAGGMKSMTGIICAAIFENDPDTIGEARPMSRYPIDDNDALRIQRAMIQLDGDTRYLLRLCYIDQSRPEMICKLLKLPVRPPTEFVARVRAAQAAIELLANNQGMK